MKNIANCNPVEFLVQTNKIRKRVKEWLDLTKVLDIRKNKPDIKEDASDEEKKAAINKQVKENLNGMLDKILDEYPKETAELLGLLCFIEPEDLENHKASELFSAAAEIMNSQEVIDFFYSLAKLGVTNTSPSAKQ